MKMSTFFAKHQDTGIRGESWDAPEGFVRTCSCGWSKSYRNMNAHGAHLHAEHIDEEAEKAGIGHVPSIMNPILDEMIENRKGWCRDTRTIDAENFQMNRIFNEIRHNLARMEMTEEEFANGGANKFLFGKGPLYNFMDKKESN